MRHRVKPEIVDFAARDGFGLNFHHYPCVGPGQAIVVHGADVRANLLFPSTVELSSKRCRMSATMSDILTKAWAINPAVLEQNHIGSMR